MLEMVLVEKGVLINPTHYQVDVGARSATSQVALTNGLSPILPLSTDESDGGIHL